MTSLACVSVPFKAYLNVFQALASGKLGKGEFVEKLEQKFSNYLGVKHTIAVCNGTVADIIMLQALKYLYPNRTEVILPALTFIAQANAVLWAGLRPVFVDVGDDFQINENDAKKLINKNTLCVFPAHLLGNPSLLPALFRSDNIDIPVLEDCCEAMGGKFMHYRLGTLGLGASFSMFPSHTITTGEGGLIVTDNQEFADLCRSIRDHGKVGKDFDFNYVGINGKMSNILAGIGCALIDRIDEVNKIRRKNVLYLSRFKTRTKTSKYLFTPYSPHCFPIVFRSIEHRNYALSKFRENGIECRKLMSCVPDTKPYIELFGMYLEEGFFDKAREFANFGMYVPCHQNLTEKELEKIGHVISQV